MKKIKGLLVGYLGFFIVSSTSVSLAFLIYSSISVDNNLIIALLLLLIIIFTSLCCLIFELIRRKYMVETPLQKILNATRQMSKGDFNIKLIPKHLYADYDEFDLIKEDLNNMANSLSKSELLKNDFISNVSHEIKTPLAIIQNYAKMLENPNITNEDKIKYLSSLQSTCKKLNNLVMNILKLNKLENQHLSLNCIKFNISQVLIDQILLFEDLIDSKNLQLNLDIEEDLYIVSEQNYLEIIFNNIISNAIKFSKENGFINISLKKQNDLFIILFEDSGCGMTKETGMYIFDKFYQGETSHNHEGNGLGLALVKKVIDLLGGEIKVESELNKGTIFTIIIRGNKDE